MGYRKDIDPARWAAFEADHNGRLSVPESADVAEQCSHDSGEWEGRHAIKQDTATGPADGSALLPVESDIERATALLYRAQSDPDTVPIDDLRTYSTPTDPTLGHNRRCTLRVAFE